MDDPLVELSVIQTNRFYRLLTKCLLLTLDKPQGGKVVIRSCFVFIRMDASCGGIRLIDATMRLLVVQTEEVKVAWTASRLLTLIQSIDGTNFS